MKQFVKALFLIGMGFVVSVSCLASPVTIKEQLEYHFPELPVDAISPAPMKGFQQVSSGANVLYVTNDGKYIMTGDIIDLAMATPINLTEEARENFRVRALAELDPLSIITYHAARERHMITVFTDIDCTYCRKLHKEVSELNDLGVSVRYLAFPRAGIESSSYEKAVSVWCANEVNKTFDEAKEGKSIRPATCDNPIQQQFELGMKLGVNATPTIILDDGRVIPGYLSADELLAVIEKR